MKRITKKELKNYITLGLAKSIDNCSHNECRTINENCNFEKVAYCIGVYGISGGLLKDKDTGDMYAITARNSSLFFFF